VCLLVTDKFTVDSNSDNNDDHQDIEDHDDKTGNHPLHLGGEREKETLPDLEDRCEYN
jgi:hypothetical protein